MGSKIVDYFPFPTGYRQFLNILKLSFMIFALQVFVLKNNLLSFTLVWTVSLATLHVISEKSVQLNAPVSTGDMIGSRAETPQQFPVLPQGDKKKDLLPRSFLSHKIKAQEDAVLATGGLTAKGAMGVKAVRSHLGQLPSSHDPPTTWRDTGRAQPSWGHGRSPRGCSPRGSPRGQCHPAGAGSCIWSPCRRSCPPCTRPRAPPDGCGTWGGCSHPSGPARTSSSESGSGKRLCRCRTRGHPLLN